MGEAARLSGSWLALASSFDKAHSYSTFKIEPSVGLLPSFHPSFGA